MENHQLVLVLDFGGQYNQLIARRVREHNVYCEVKPYKTSIEEIKALNPIGIIFTGGPNSVYEEKSPKCDPALFELGVPVLGICYGSQLMMHLLGGHVCRAPEREYGKTETFYNTDCKLFKGLPEQGISWMSHGDYMAKVPEGFELVAHTEQDLLDIRNFGMKSIDEVKDKLQSMGLSLKSSPLGFDTNNLEGGTFFSPEDE